MSHGSSIPTRLSPSVHLSSETSRRLSQNRREFTEEWANGLTLASVNGMDLTLLLQRVRAEFNEMPGLRLTPPQAARLLGLDHMSCDRVIDLLVNSAFLRWTPDGSVVRTES